MQGIVDQRIDALQKNLPGFVLAGSFQDLDGQSYLSLIGTIQAIRDVDSLPYYLNALKRGLPMDLHSNGELTFPVTARPDRTPVQDFEGKTFTVELQIYDAPRHPEIYVLDPAIGREAFPGLRHIYLKTHPKKPELNRICIFPPHHGVWDWENGRLETLILWLAQWLISFEVFLLTRQWVGPEASHDPQKVLRAARRHQQCQCGSGVPIKECPNGCAHRKASPPSTFEQQFGVRVIRP